MRRLGQLILAGVLAVAMSGVGQVFGPVTSASGADSTGHLSNASFEHAANPPTGLPRAWSTTSWAHVATESWVSDVSRRGQHSVRISASSPDDAAWVQTVPVLPHTLYRLSGWIKTDGVPSTSSSGANLGFFGTWTHTPGLTGTHRRTFASVVMDSGDQNQLTIGARLGYWADTTTGTAWFDDLKLAPVLPLDPAPGWKILVLIYPQTDFVATDQSGAQHHYHGTMTRAQKQAAAVQATRFVTEDIPTLDSGEMVPTVTVRYPGRPLALDSTGGGYWPSPTNTAPERDGRFDSVIVIWQPTVVDSATGHTTWIGSAAGLTPARGTGQAYATLIIEAATSYGHRNVFKHEWGHSILSFFDAARTSPLPTVTNHAVAGQYVHCPTGQQYVWVDETDANPIPNSIYNDASGFTHDYYSGTTATADAPDRCLGATSTAWAYGGPLRLGPVLR